MQNNIRNTNLRFNLGKNSGGEPGNILQTMDRQDLNLTVR